MTRHPVGQPVTLSTQVRVGGVLTNAGSISLVVRRPDLTEITYSSLNNPSTGNYNYDVPTSDLTQTGHYQYKFVSTGVGAGVGHDEYDVYDPWDITIVSVQSAKEQLNIGTTAHDAELERFVAAAIDVVERYVGAVAKRTISEVADSGPGWRSVMLRSKTPVYALTSMTNLADGVSAYAVADLYIANDLAGIVKRRDGGTIVGGPWTVVYVAGRAQVPAVADLAGMMIVQHLWETRRGVAGAPRVAGAEPTTLIPGIGYAVPNRVLELLEGERLPVMAA